MFIYNFYVGTADKNTLKQELPERLFYSCFDFVFDNYTITKVQGRYTMTESKTVITEDSFQVTVINIYSDEELKEKVNYLKKFLNQESILVTIDKTSDICFM